MADFALHDASTRWQAWRADDRMMLSQLEALHATNPPSRAVAIADAARVPRIIHHIWLGSPLPSDLAALVATWRDLHPTWRHIMWDDAATAEFDLTNRAAFDAAANYGEKSDVLRYEILAQMGGVYVDIDMECVSAMDSLAERYSFVVGISNSGTVELNNAIVMSRAHHPIIEACVVAVAANCATATSTEPSLLPFQHAREEKRARAEKLVCTMGAFLSADAAAALRTAHSPAPPPPSDPIWTIARTGPGMLTRVFCAAIVADADRDGDGDGDGSAAAAAGSIVGAIALPPTFFYPLPNSARDEVRPFDERGKEFCSEQTICIHYWSQTWQKKD